MTCDDCVTHFSEALESVPGVRRASVDLERRSAVVAADAGVVADVLAEAVRSRGYNAFERGRRSA
ncbi:MAG: cation transporter [Candidatus Limnocylindrales bacterium]